MQMEFFLAEIKENKTAEEYLHQHIHSMISDCLLS